MAPSAGGFLEEAPQVSQSVRIKMLTRCWASLSTCLLRTSAAEHQFTQLSTAGGIVSKVLLAKLLVGIHSCSQRSGSHVA